MITAYTMTRSLLLGLLGLVGLSTSVVPASTPTPALTSRSAQSHADLIPYFKGGLWGYSDAERHLIVPPRYETAERFHDGRALVSSAGLKGFIDERGTELIPLRYRHADAFSEGLAQVGLTVAGEDRFGFVDRDGKVVVPIEYSGASGFVEGVAKVFQGLGRYSHWGLVDTKGHFLVPPGKYVFIGAYSEELAPVYEENDQEIQRFGFVDRKGHEVIPVSRYWSWGHERWSDGRFAVRHKGKWGYIDHSGREVIPTIYENAGAFDQGRAVVKLNGSDLVIDVMGDSATPTVRYEADGLREIEVEGKRAWVGAKGRQVIPPRYERNLNEVCPDWPLQDGLRGVTRGEKHGFINGQGVEVIPVQYECTGRPSDGMISVWQGKLAGYVDLAGKQVIPFRYRKAEPFDNGLALVGLPADPFNKWVRGYVNKRGVEFFEGPETF